MTQGMRPSANRHVLARLRQIVGLNQTDFAAIANCSPSTIQAIELGRLRLSESLASKIAIFTGVSHVWLLQNDLESPPFVSSTFPVYTKEVFERVQAARLMEFHPKIFNAECLIYYARMKAIFSAAMTSGLTDYRLANFKFNTALDELEKEFGSDKTVFEIPEGQFCWDGAKAIEIAKQDVKEAEDSGKKLGLPWVYYGKQVPDEARDQIPKTETTAKRVKKQGSAKKSGRSRSKR